MSIDSFHADIHGVLTLYTNNVSDEMHKWLEKAARDTAKELRETSPKKSGKYAKGWTVKKMHGNWIVYNKDRPGLAHLLEHGHPIVRNGQTIGTAGASPHIKDAEDHADQRVEELIERLNKL